MATEVTATDCFCSWFHEANAMVLGQFHSKPQSFSSSLSSHPVWALGWPWGLGQMSQASGRQARKGKSTLGGMPMTEVGQPGVEGTRGERRIISETELGRAARHASWTRRQSIDGDWATCQCIAGLGHWGRRVQHGRELSRGTASARTCGDRNPQAIHS